MTHLGYAKALFMTLFMSLSTLSWAAEEDPTAKVKPSHNWQLLLFTIPGCSSCITMRDQVIHPMIAAGIIQPDQFEEVVQVSDADWQYVRGAGYKQIREWKTIYKTSLFPTLVITDRQGNKIADNIVGMTSAEHYRTKLENLLKTLP